MFCITFTIHYFRKVLSITMFCPLNVRSCFGLNTVKFPLKLLRIVLISKEQLQKLFFFEFLRLSYCSEKNHCSFSRKHQRFIVNKILLIWMKICEIFLKIEIFLENAKPLRKMVYLRRVVTSLADSENNRNIFLRKIETFQSSIITNQTEILIKLFKKRIIFRARVDNFHRVVFLKSYLVMAEMHLICFT